MTYKKWTPGPWVWVNNSSADSDKLVTLAPDLAPKDEYNDDETDHILSSSEWLSVNPHDAHLIAAAPDLYEACEAVFDAADMTDKEQYAALRLVVAALAKARGEK